MLTICKQLFYTHLISLRSLKTYLVLLGVILVFGFAHSAFAMTSNITLTPPSMVDTFGKQMSAFQADQQIGVESTLTNHGSSEQKFTYFVQVMDSTGGTDFLQGFSASMLPNQSFTASQVWVPQHAGQYTVEVFVWNSLSSAVPLTDVLHTIINVN